MASVVNPKINVVGYGPGIKLENGVEITPDEIVYGAAGITYKDIGALQELLEMKGCCYPNNEFLDMKDERKKFDFSRKIIESLIKSAGAGHASMATTPGLWVFLEGDCSKLVDSIFTTARFSSSLMPSGRRIPITKDNIVVPAGIESNPKAREIYISAMEKNIDAYGWLQNRGENSVSKEEAAKIVPYGHKGGGFMFMPLETLIYFSKESERVGDLMPEEGRQVIRKLEKFVCDNGMKVVYEARKEAPRTTGVNPSIFHEDDNFAHEWMDLKSPLKDDILLGAYDLGSSKRDKRIREFLAKRDKIFSEPEKIAENWRGLLSELASIITDYNDSVTVKTLVNTPWRVWGEVKRHRTLPQTAESIYHAVDRAGSILFDINRDELFLKRVFSVPYSVLTNEENFELWNERILHSIEAYDELLNMGIKKSDAIAVVPRGLKLGIIKNYDLYNLTTGYASLRLCNTAEKEMKETTERERELVRNSGVSADLTSLLVPKCNYVGFCPDNKFCKNILSAVPKYNNEIHKNIAKIRDKEIRAKLNYD